MSETTSIGWTDATFNPWWGCERVSPGCAHCYADTLATRYGFGETWGDGHGFRFFGDKHWDEPRRWARTLPAKLGRRPRVFCASMADVFEERDELDEPRDRLFSLIYETPELDWLILTKRPEAARDYLVDAYSYCGRWEFNDYEHDGQPLPNIWLGVSIENSRYTWRADVLREIPAAVRFISAEPLLGSLFDAARDHDVVETVPNGYGGETYAVRGRKPLNLTGIDWVIVGGESGGKARPLNLADADALIANAREFDTAVFVKQLGSVWAQDVRKRWQINADGKGEAMEHWPERLRIREFPASRARAPEAMSTRKGTGS